MRQLNYLRHQPSFEKSPVRTLSRLALWRLRCAVRLSSAIVSFPDWNVRMEIPCQWPGVAKLMFAFRERYEQEMVYLHDALSPGMVFVDVGASFGIYTLMASRMVGAKGVVVSMEPSRATYEVLRRNLALNSVANVRAHALALADGRSTRTLYHHPDPGRNSFGQATALPLSSEDVDTTSLDHLLSKEGITQVDFMKVDVEGAEELVLIGARALLARSRPEIIFEFNPEATRSIGLRPLGAWELLESQGYSLFRSDIDGRLSPLHSPPDGGNIVARAR